MPRPEKTKHLQTDIPADHPALVALEAYRKEWNFKENEALEHIVLAWAKAYNGDISALGALSIHVPTGSIPATPVAPSEETPRRVVNGNAKAFSLD